MKMRGLIHHRRVLFSLLMCCLLALLAACTVNLGPSPAGTPVGPGVGGNNPAFPSSRQPTGTSPASSPSHYLIINSAFSYYAINATTGSVIWDLQNNGFTAAPIVANGQVYILKQDLTTASNQIVDIDELSGKQQRWSYSLGQTQPSYVYMALADNVVVAYVGNVGLIGMNAQTGAKLWQVPLSTSFPSTTNLQTSGNVVYIPTTNSLDAYDVGTGRLLWLKSYIFQITSSPGAAFVDSSCPSGYYNTFCLSSYDPSSGTQRWSSPAGVKSCKPGSYTCNSSIYSNGLFVGGNTVYAFFSTTTNPSPSQSSGGLYIDAFNASTGSLLWEYSIPNSQWQGNQTSPNFNMIGADSSAVYYENPVGTITALSATNHTVLWKYVDPNGQENQFLESNDAIELLNNTTVTALSRQTGAQLWVAQLS